MKNLIKNKWWYTQNCNIPIILYLLVDRPDRINKRNDFYWRNNKKQWHRDYNLPALILHDGFVYWYKNGYVL